MSEDWKTIRKATSRLPRRSVERIIKLYRPKAKPWLSNLPDLRDQLAILMAIDPAIVAAVERETHG